MNDTTPSTGGEVIVFEAPDGTVQVDVHIAGETVWLSLTQMAELFGRDKSVVSRHLRNIFASGELDREAVVAKNATTAADGKTYKVEFFNLDAILSVGYRVNSKRGTQFRIWATGTLRKHFLDGYTLNKHRLTNRGIDIEQVVALLTRTLEANALVTDEGRSLLQVVHEYTRSWRLLLEYDEGRLPETPALPVPSEASLGLDEARGAIITLRQDLLARSQIGALFGEERGDALAGILGAIEQTFGGEPLYPSVQARAAHLLYFIIKDHPFGDGNKRIGTLLFLEYLQRNKMLTRADGSLRLDDNAMVALALLIAESDPAQKDLMIRLVLNLLGGESR